MADYLVGHTNILTTKNYLGSFGNEVRKGNAGRLTAFESKKDEYV
jgi:hypothetical protein